MVYLESKAKSGGFRGGMWNGPGSKNSKNQARVDSPFSCSDLLLTILRRCIAEFPVRLRTWPTLGEGLDRIRDTEKQMCQEKDGIGDVYGVRGRFSCEDTRTGQRHQARVSRAFPSRDHGTACRPPTRR